MAYRPNEVLFELIPRGRYLKINAIDPATLVEVSVVGPADRDAVAGLKQLAVRKLEYVIARRSQKKGQGQKPPSASGGFFV